MTQLSGQSPQDPFLEGRLTAAIILALCVWGALLGRLFHLQVIQGDEYLDSAKRNSVRTHRVQASRGMILDRTGKILVDARPSYDVLVVPHETDELEKTLRRISLLGSLEPNAVIQSFGRPRGRARFQALPVGVDLDRDALSRIRARQWALPGVLTEASEIRAYRYGELASHVLGWLGEIDADQLKKRDYAGYRRGDTIGREGIERRLDRELRGRDGGRNVLVDAHGREGETLGELAAIAGRNVVLTIDQGLQAVAEAALDRAERSGAVVALDPRDGAVLVLASRPGFDPNLFAKGIDAETWRSINSDSRHRLHNRAVQGVYPPGSTYKVVTALAALEEGVTTPEETIDCYGSIARGRRRYRCWKRGGHGAVQLRRAIVESCDVYFYEMGQRLGVDKLAYYARALGLGQRTGIDLAGESAGLVPTRAWKERRFSEIWMPGETISLSIGQGFNLWTPLQLAHVYAVIGNGGTQWRPYVVAAIQDPDGGRREVTQPEKLGTVPISDTSLAIVRSALLGVVQERRGTGYVMRGLPGDVAAAGKTGTAQVVKLAADPPGPDVEIPVHRRDHAWFVTYTPAENPEIVVAVLVEHGGHGSSAAAPIAREVVSLYLETRGEAPLYAGN